MRHLTIYKKIMSILGLKPAINGITQWQNSEKCMCRLRNMAMSDYQESVTTCQTDGQTDTRQSDLYVPLCFAGATKIVHLVF